MCGNLTCKDRQRVVLADDGVVKPTTEKAAALPQLTGRKQADIEPIEQEAL